MITLNITPDGEITISQETPGERIYMGEHYARMEREETETQRDEERGAFFKQGWESAIREAQLNYVNGRLEDFFNEMKVGDINTEKSEDVAEEGWGEDIPEADPPVAPIYETGLPIETGLARPVEDSGEPEKEHAFDPTPQRGAGTWTISDEELQALKDAEFERGIAYESPTVPRRYSDQELEAIKNDAFERGVAKVQNSEDYKKVVKFSHLRTVADKLAGSTSDGAVRPTLDDLIREIATELGYEVVL